MQTHHLDLDGLVLRWEEQAGSGPPVVLLHGIPTSPALWHEVAERLPGRRLLAFEMVGYGDSIPQGEGRDLSLSAQADHVAAWWDRLGLGPAVLGGHDLGGGVAQILAVRRPDLVAGLLLTNAVCYDSWPIPLVRAMQPASDQLRRLPEVMVRATLAQLMLRGHDTPARARRALERHFRPYAEHGAGAAMGRQIAALDPADTMEVGGRLGQLDVPARVVWGTGDGFQPPIYGERLARDLGTRPIALAGAKHFTPENHPGELAHQLGELCAETA
jgi:pimeloyl-ACP methyl ester carboxylesterase